jgi:hypothetical protein
MNDGDGGRVAAYQQLRAAQEGLHQLDALITACDGAVGATLVRDRAAAARSQVDEAVRLLANEEEASRQPARVPCSFCGQMIMPAATLCGFCWRKRTPARA